jgi:uncharacterized protein (DUF433 family)
MPDTLSRHEQRRNPDDHRGWEDTMKEVMTNLPDRIDIDPGICFGKPRVKGTRISVGLVLGLLADGMTEEEILRDYPQLTVEDMRACLDYGARVTSGRFIDVM